MSVSPYHKRFLQRCKWRWKESSTTWRLYQWKKCRQWPRASSPPPSWSHWPGPLSCRGETWQPCQHQFQENRSQDGELFYDLHHIEDSEVCVTWEFQPPPSPPLAPDWVLARWKELFWEKIRPPEYIEYIKGLFREKDDPHSLKKMLKKPTHPQLARHRAGCNEEAREGETASVGENHLATHLEKLS